MKNSGCIRVPLDTIMLLPKTLMQPAPMTDTSGLPVRENCGATKTQVIAAYGHDYGDDNVCDRCGHSFEVHEHVFTEETVLPTCIKIGYTEYRCGCGYYYRDNITEQLGHKFGSGVVTVEKSCSSDGIMTYSCVRCDASITDIIPASHTWNETIINEATCTSDGEVKRVCEVCGAEETEVIPASHKWDEGEITSHADCLDGGKKTCTCTVCGETEEFDIPKLGHNFADGVCTRCGKGFIDTITPYEEHPVYGMYFEVDEIVSNYGPSLIDEYGVLLDYNPDATLDKVAVYLTQDGTMWRRCIACTGDDITYATYVPYLSYKSDIKYTGLNSDWINIFRLSEDSDGIWEYSNYATIGVNLEDRNGNLLLSLYDIGQAGRETRIFDDLEEMKAWLLSEDIIYGDLDGNGTVNAFDRTILARHIANWEGYSAEDFNYKAADVNNDGIVNAFDRTILTRHVANWPGYEVLPKVD